MLIWIRGVPVLIDAEDQELVETKTWHRNNRYLLSDHEGLTMTMGKFLMVMHDRVQPDKQVCYGNGNRLDNRKFNLITRTLSGKRTQCQGYERMKGVSRRSELPCGVYPTRGGRYQAIVRSKGQVIYLGTWEQVEPAAEAVLEFKRNAATTNLLNRY